MRNQGFSLFEVLFFLGFLLIGIAMIASLINAVEAERNAIPEIVVSSKAPPPAEVPQGQKVEQVVKTIPREISGDRIKVRPDGSYARDFLLFEIDGQRCLVSDDSDAGGLSCWEIK